MARRTQSYIKIPWTGGINTSVDAGMLSDNDLVIADNVVFTSSGSRLKREGFEYLDSPVPTPTHVESDGTTRTIYFEGADELVQETPSVDHKLVVGEGIAVTGNSNYNTELAAVTSIDATASGHKITYTAATSHTEAKTAVEELIVERADSYLNVLDYWYENEDGNKEQLILAMSNRGKLFKHGVLGNRQEVPAADGAAPSGQITQVTSCVFNNRAIFCFDGLDDKPIKYWPLADEEEYELLATAPDASFMYEFKGRLWANDKTDRDRMHYSAPFAHETWGGTGDSGAIDISTGDGDPRGIVAGFGFKDINFVQKSTKTYRILGNTPETYTVDPVTKGLGGESPMAIVTVDQDDVVFVSKRGFHSIMATDQYGDTEGAFLSAKIQPTFNNWNKGQVRYMQGAYVPELNSIAFNVAERGQTIPSALWLYNIETKEWYRWPRLRCTSLTTILTDSVNKFIVGTNRSRLVRTQRGSFRDFENNGILYRVKSGTIYPGGNPQSIKAFKKLSLVYRPAGNYQFIVKAQVDSFAPQILVFEQEASGDVLGQNYVLGESILGVSNTLAPYTRQIDGYGRGITLEIEQTGTDQQVEIYGFIIEFEDADIEQETKEG